MITLDLQNNKTKNKVQHFLIDVVPSFPSDLVMGFGGHWHFKIFTKLFNNMGSALSATSGCGTHFWLHVIHAGRLGSECSLRLWFSFLSTTPQDLSADLSVVLISCDPALCTPSVVIRSSVCVKPTWVVRDLSAASGCGSHFSARFRKF